MLDQYFGDFVPKIFETWLAHTGTGMYWHVLASTNTYWLELTPNDNLTLLEDQIRKMAPTKKNKRN